MNPCTHGSCQHFFFLTVMKFLICLRSISSIFTIQNLYLKIKLLATGKNNTCSFLTNVINIEKQRKIKIILEFHWIVEWLFLDNNSSKNLFYHSFSLYKYTRLYKILHFKCCVDWSTNFLNSPQGLKEKSVSLQEVSGLPKCRCLVTHRFLLTEFRLYNEGFGLNYALLCILGSLYISCLLRKGKRECKLCMIFREILNQGFSKVKFTQFFSLIWSLFFIKIDFQPLP